MKLLITGAHGQLGTALMQQAQAHQALGVDHEQLDITDAKAVAALMDSYQPDAVINAAAYTAVDKAEADSDAAFSVNRDGPANLAIACEKASIPLVHVSTDYVFDGNKKDAYLESDAVSPLGVYGVSKEAGEAAVRKACSKHLILRTSWVFSAHGNNFVKTMLRLGSERDTLGVVADQFGKPTSAAELARVILEVLPKAEGRWGTYHLAQPEVISWHGFASSIFKEAEMQGVSLELETLNAISTLDYPTPAKRPANSELDCNKIEETFDVEIQPWKHSLQGVVCELVGNL